VICVVKISFLQTYQINDNAACGRVLNSDRNFVVAYSVPFSNRLQCPHDGYWGEGGGEDLSLAVKHLKISPPLISNDVVSAYGMHRALPPMSSIRLHGMELRLN
jgi:hypothetical protein